MTSTSAASSANALLIDMWSDFVCPFCYIGKRKLEHALKDLGFEIRDAGNGKGLPAAAARDAADAKKIAYIRYRAFELDPNGPKINPENIATHLSRKYGMPEQAAQANLEGMAKEAKKPGVDLVFNYQKLKICNTFDAHRVLHFAQEKSAGDNKIASAIKERFLKAYFTDELALGDDATIMKLATECGLDAAEVEKVLSDKKLFADDVRADEQQARQMRINGVPYFWLNESVAINGAQSPEQMKETILRALHRK